MQALGGQQGDPNWDSGELLDRIIAPQNAANTQLANNAQRPNNTHPASSG